MDLVCDDYGLVNAPFSGTLAGPVTRKDGAGSRYDGVKFLSDGKDDKIWYLKVSTLNHKLRKRSRIKKAVIFCRLWTILSVIEFALIRGDISQDKWKDWPSGGARQNLREWPRSFKSILWAPSTNLHTSCPILRFHKWWTSNHFHWHPSFQWLKNSLGNLGRKIPSRRNSGFLLLQKVMKRHGLILNHYNLALLPLKANTCNLYCTGPTLGQRRR